MIKIARRLGRLAGLAISTVAVVVFLFVFIGVLQRTDVREVASLHWQAVLAATFLYGLAYVPMTASWIVLAGAAGARTSPSALVRVLLISQIGKYFPGNVAQFLGRAYIARSYGVPLASSGLAITLELAGILAASGILAAAAMTLGMSNSKLPAASGMSWITGLVAVAAIFASLWVLRNKSERVRSLMRPLGLAVCLYVVVLALLAIGNVVLISTITDAWSLSIAGAVASAFVVSWLIGFATPGSPAGLGLRELSFLALLNGTVPHDAVLLSATAFRLATILGDIVAWLIGLIIPVPPSESDRRPSVAV